MIYQIAERRIVGPAGDLLIPDGDEITPRLLMLIEGQCEGLGPMLAAQKYGLSRQRYYQVQKQFPKNGLVALFSQKRNTVRHQSCCPARSVKISQNFRKA
jgi:hypothetical protein